MEISYNGITLEVVKTNNYEQAAVYSPDGTDYLYTRHTLDVQCVFNPYATAYNNEGNATPGTYPALTARNIRQYLLEPRKTLKVSVASDVILNVPWPRIAADKYDTTVGDGDRFTTDSFNGPKPIACTVMRVDGKKSFIVNYRIETYVNECPTQNATIQKAVDNPVLSHRWQSMITVDEQFFTVKVIEGRIKFRTDWLTAEGMQQLADAFREKFFHKIEARFKREQINIYATPDGSELVYQVVDREQAYSLGLTSAATKIEAFYTVTAAPPPPAEGQNKGAVPYLSGNVAVRIWGRAGQISWNLYKIAIAIASHKLTGGKIYRWSVREALHVPFLELDATAYYAPSDGAHSNLLPLTETNFKPVGDLNPVPGIFERNQDKNPRPGDNTDGAESSSGEAWSRGWAAIKLITAALKGECNPIQAPPNSVSAY